jgi:cyclic pyranopterin monophosphate synthase
MADLTHFDPAGAARMVDVSAKPPTHRTATASAVVRMKPTTAALARGGMAAKGDVLAVARVAAIQAAKKTSDLIPLCHPLPLSSVTVAFTFPADDTVRIEATAGVFAATGVEMEALTAVSVAALTVYDMLKAVDRGMTIEAVRLEHKTGGASGEFRRGD